MKIAIMQPYFFPYLGYYQLIASADRFLFYDNLTCSQKWITQNRILQVNRTPLPITAPIIGYHSANKICEVKINATSSWKSKFLKQLYFNYKNAAFYTEAIGIIEEALRIETSLLSDLNIHSSSTIARFLEIPTEIAVITAPQSDLIEQRLEHMYCARQVCVYEKKVQRILDICSRENADTYINARGGMELYDKAVFKQNGIDLRFNVPKPIVYHQLAPAFVPDLSIIDVLMNCGKSKTRELLSEYALV